MSSGKVSNRFERCETCGEYGFTDTHRCPPAWEARFGLDDDDDWKVVYAYDEEIAAQKFSELHMDSESDKVFEVLVRPAWTNKQPSIFTIEFEYEPRYLLTRKE